MLTGALTGTGVLSYLLICKCIETAERDAAYQRAVEVWLRRSFDRPAGSNTAAC
jgi:hypothetical protein